MLQNIEFSVLIQVQARGECPGTFPDRGGAGGKFDTLLQQVVDLQHLFISCAVLWFKVPAMSPGKIWEVFDVL